MRILGIDPGFGRIGYGVIDKGVSRPEVVDYGIIETPKELPFVRRLEIVYNTMNALCTKFKPDELAIEQLFFSKNITTCIPVAEARGVILLAFTQQKVPIFEYGPLDVKLALTGMGRADKSQVQFMVKTLLGLAKVPRPDDVADALAIALCHLQTNQQMRGKIN